MSLCPVLWVEQVQTLDSRGGNTDSHCRTPIQECYGFVLKSPLCVNYQENAYCYSAFNLSWECLNSDISKNHSRTSKKLWPPYLYLECIVSVTKAKESHLKYCPKEIIGFRDHKLPLNSLYHLSKAPQHPSPFLSYYNYGGLPGDLFWRACSCPFS